MLKKNILVMNCDFECSLLKKTAHPYLALRSEDFLCSHPRQVILHGPVNVRVGDRVVATFGASTFDTEPFEKVEHRRLHFMRPSQIHCVGRQPFSTRFR